MSESEVVEFETTDGMKFKVDKKFSSFVNKFTWRAYSNGKSSIPYVRTKVGKRNIIYLHRLIAALNSIETVDHINGDTLNNSVENLRACSRSENAANSVRVRKVSPYRGVLQSKNRWRATISHKCITYRLGSFDDPESAARAYDKKAMELFGQYAILNFPPEGWHARYGNSSRAIPKKSAALGSSRFRGVMRPTGRDRWRAMTSSNNASKCLGYFASELDAAIAYDAHVIGTHGHNRFTNYKNLMTDDERNVAKTKISNLLKDDRWIENMEPLK